MLVLTVACWMIKQWYLLITSIYLPFATNQFVTWQQIIKTCDNGCFSYLLRASVPILVEWLLPTGLTIPGVRSKRPTTRRASRPCYARQQMSWPDSPENRHGSPGTTRKIRWSFHSEGLSWSAELLNQCCESFIGCSFSFFCVYIVVLCYFSVGSCGYLQNRRVEKQFQWSVMHCQGLLAIISHHHHYHHQAKAIRNDPR